MDLVVQPPGVMQRREEPKDETCVSSPSNITLLKKVNSCVESYLDCACQSCKMEVDGTEVWRRNDRITTHKPSGGRGPGGDENAMAMH